MTAHLNPRFFNQALKEYFEDFASKVTRRVCKDQYVGLVKGTGYTPGSDEKKFSHRKDPSQRPRENPPIILILESPHKAEYRPAKPVPANGTTGRNIRKYIHLALRDHLTGDITRPLILVNAIQYQCSAGVKTEAHRSGIFRRMWQNQDVRNNLAGRIRDYIADDPRAALIVNACTEGEQVETDDRDLYCLVEDVLYSHFGGSDLSVPHPSSWLPRKGGLEPIIEQRGYTPRPGLPKGARGPERVSARVSKNSSDATRHDTRREGKGRKGG